MKKCCVIKNDVLYLYKKFKQIEIMKAEEKAKDLINRFGGDAYELPQLKIRELELELKYWKSVLEEIEKL